MIIDIMFARLIILSLFSAQSVGKEKSHEKSSVFAATK